jgi:predicted patatin/cPLA2 family phospholipase
MPGELLGPEHVGLYETISPHPAVQVMAARLFSGSQRKNRTDGHVVALAIEGGGSAGAVSAGKCVAMESSGLIKTVDRVYGASSGALNGAFTGSGQAALGATNYEDTAGPEFVSMTHLLKRKSIADFDYVFIDVMGRKEPYAFDRLLADGPSFTALAVNLKTREAETLSDFEDRDDLMKALRASCAMPVYSGRPVRYRGKRMTDGALRASVPFRAALDEGATHVLALRTRGEEYRKKPYKFLEIQAARWLPIVGSRALGALVAERTALYNEDADELQYGNSQAVLQITPPEEEPVAQLEKSRDAIRAGFHLGVNAVAQAFGMPDLSVTWEPLPVITLSS